MLGLKLQKAENHLYRENWKLYVERLLDERIPKQIMKHQPRLPQGKMNGIERLEEAQADPWKSMTRRNKRKT
jgi:hypothetical protein